MDPLKLLHIDFIKPKLNFSYPIEIYLTLFDHKRKVQINFIDYIEHNKILNITVQMDKQIVELYPNLTYDEFNQIYQSNHYKWKIINNIFDQLYDFEKNYTKHNHKWIKKRHVRL